MKWIWNGFTVQKAKLTSDEPGQARKEYNCEKQCRKKFCCTVSPPQSGQFLFTFCGSRIVPLQSPCGPDAVLRCAVKRNAMRGHSRIAVFRTAASACYDGFFIVNQVGGPCDLPVCLLRAEATQQDAPPHPHRVTLGCNLSSCCRLLRHRQDGLLAPVQC